MMQPEKIKLIDRDDVEVMELLMPAREPGDPARSITWQGRRFVESEGGPKCFYPRGWFIEVQEAA